MLADLFPTCTLDLVYSGMTASVHSEVADEQAMNIHL